MYLNDVFEVFGALVAAVYVGVAGDISRLAL